jgi:wyosine [tRNA(Phe)-imidazoG37] synthetase (radical SAM superfamily)
MTYLFGPVNSRRLGRSLGVDLIPPKTCPFDCVYCEVGPTTRQTMERRDWHTGEIIRELEDFLSGPGAAPDYITLAGSGEPTLNLGLGRIIHAVKERCTIPVAVLTNGALLHLPEVRRELAAADVVLPSLDAAREETFRAINRPLPELYLKLILDGLMAFRQEYAGQIWLEVMLLKGVNDMDADLSALRQAIRSLEPDKVQLNTAVRPGTEAWIEPLSLAEMAAVATFLGERVEVIAAFSQARVSAGAGNDGVFLEMLARRPMTAKDLAQALGVPVAQVLKRLERLQAAGLISYDRYHDRGFYRTPAHLI